MAKDHTLSIGDMHTELYTQCFTGQALSFCSKCKRSGHSAASCLAKASPQAPFRAPGASAVRKPVCKQNNKGGCTFANCSYCRIGGRRFSTCTQKTRYPVE
eukprot:scpid98997/ scgid25801/ 